MSRSADEYRRKAEVALALAEATQDQSVKETYREVAELWKKLAERAEKTTTTPDVFLLARWHARWVSGRRNYRQ
jgi:ABC-type uncharacterized transport system fused permease/ATPase subunit